MTDSAKTPNAAVRAWQWLRTRRLSGFERRACQWAHRSWVVQFGLLALVFALLHNFFSKMLYKFPQEIYDESFIGLGWFAKPKRLVILLVLFAVCVWFRKRLTWKRLGSRWVRVLLSATLIVMTWNLATFGFNHYTGHGYWIDRLLLVGLTALALWHPKWVVLLLGHSLLYLGQQRLSIGDIETTDKFPLIDTMVVIVAFMLIRSFLPIRRRSLVWFLLVLQSINYFAPGIAKLIVVSDPLAWVTENPLEALVATGYHHGWFYWTDLATVESLAGVAASVGLILAIFTILNELGFALAPIGRRIGAAFLCLAIGMHLGIFTLTGIFFWKWILFDALLLACLLRMRRDPKPTRKRRIIAVIVLFACFPLYARPEFLGWMDTRVSETYFYEVVTESGEVYRIDQADMSPYDITIEQGGMHYANPSKVITYHWDSAKHPEQAAAINAIRTEAELRDFIDQHGEVQFNPERNTELKRFWTRYLRHANQHAGEYRWLNRIGPPTHMQVRSGGDRYDFAQPAKTLRVRFQRSFYDGERIRIVDDRVVQEFEIEE